MQENKFIWRRIGIIIILLPVCLYFPYILLIIILLMWSIYKDLSTPHVISPHPTQVKLDAKADDDNWLNKFCSCCKSPAEETFLRAMVSTFNLRPNGSKLISSSLTLEIQVNIGNYRFDFLLNGRQLIEIEEFGLHSSPEQIERDRVRDEYSVKQGYRILRIPARVLFKTPDKAISQVKQAIVSTPFYTQPVKQQSAASRTSSVFLMSTLSEGVITFNRYIERARVKQLALADFKLAVSTEQMLLEGLVSRVEHDIHHDARIKAMSLSDRNNYEEAKIRLKLVLNDSDLKSSSGEIYCWKEIIKPSPINDAEIQEQIDREYKNEMDQRDIRLALLTQKCASDQEFAQRFFRKIQEANYPGAEMISNTTIQLLDKKNPKKRVFSIKDLLE